MGRMWAMHDTLFLNMEQQHIMIPTSSPSTKQNQSIEATKHKKTISFFYIFESDYFSSQYLQFRIADILNFCPLEASALNEEYFANENVENEQIALAIQQSLNQKMEMVQLQQSSIYNFDDPHQRKKAIKQRIKAEEEAAFQESIRNLSELQKQRAIYDRIQAKNERKKQKAIKRQKMLNAPSMDQIAQQKAILEQIAAQKQEVDNVPPAAFQIFHQ